MRVLIERLPVASAYRQAVLDDPEVAEELAARDDGDGPPPPPPPLSEWTPTVSHLARISDQLQALRIAVVVGNGGKAPQFSATPRPVTGVERVRNLRELQRHYDLVDEVKAAQERWERNRREAADDA